MDTNSTSLRIQLVKMAIRVLERHPEDPRQPDALAHYQKQLKELQSRAKPQDVVIRAKTGVIKVLKG